VETIFWCDYDPFFAFPLLFWLMCPDLKQMPCGPLDQSSAETRSDVLTFTTPVLEEDVWTTGTFDLPESNSDR
jgi:hypothetical protein